MAVAAIDDALTTDAEYLSCDWIESGLAFNRRSLHSCLIVHHGRGFPFITSFSGGDVPIDAVMRTRDEIRAANRNDGYSACRGCVHLQRRAWRRRPYQIHFLGIAHYAHCNLECSYCFLQTQPVSSYADGLRPYPILETIRQLIDSGALAPDAIVDWGGGEPTIYREFDDLMRLLLAHGTFHFLHTNAVRLPDSIRETASPERVHVICSVDAGWPETYANIKGRSSLDDVWTNLRQYVYLGTRATAKYIVMPENHAERELVEFVRRAVEARVGDILLDIDYNRPIPDDDVVHALGKLKHLALQAGLHVRFGFTGDNHTPENNVGGRVEAAFNAEQLRSLSELLRSRGYVHGESVDIAVANLVRTLEAHRELKDSELRQLHDACTANESMLGLRGVVRSRWRVARRLARLPLALVTRTPAGR
jgi:uncharacterized Fe-S cluster-containing radical SAM superfamily protein